MQYSLLVRERGCISDLRHDRERVVDAKLRLCLEPLP